MTFYVSRSVAAIAYCCFLSSGSGGFLFSGIDGFLFSAIEVFQFSGSEGFLFSSSGNGAQESNEIPIRKGERKSITISPKLFTASLEDLFRNFDWSNRGVSINGHKLSNLRFADDVTCTIIAQPLEGLEMVLMNPQ